MIGRLVSNLISCCCGATGGQLGGRPGASALGGGFHRHRSGACEVPMSSTEAPLCEGITSSLHQLSSCCQGQLSSSSLSSTWERRKGALSHPSERTEMCNEGVSAWERSFDRIFLRGFSRERSPLPADSRGRSRGRLNEAVCIS